MHRNINYSSWNETNGKTVVNWNSYSISYNQFSFQTTWSSLNPFLECWHRGFFGSVIYQFISKAVEVNNNTCGTLNMSIRWHKLNLWLVESEKDLTMWTINFFLNPNIIMNLSEHHNILKQIGSKLQLKDTFISRI